VLRKIEDRLRDCWQDARLFEIWSEYYTAIRVQAKNPEWKIKVARGKGYDIVCFNNGEQEKRAIKIQVKTGMWQTWPFDGSKLTCADAVFTPFQIEKPDSFQYAVFLVHEEYKKIKWIFVFCRKDLEEIKKREGNRASDYFISKVESLNDYKKWQKQFAPPEPIYNVERLLVEKPKMFLNKWDKIK
jgi:hypothetical protein